MSHSWPYETVPLQLKLQQSACSFCRVRKLKCDGIAPACSSCIKYHRTADCSLRSQQTGQDQDYTGYLEQRIRDLEEYLKSPPSRVGPEEATDLAKSINDLDTASVGFLPTTQHNFPLLKSILAFACVSDPTEDEGPPGSFPQRGTGLRLTQYYIGHVHSIDIHFMTVQSIWEHFNLVYSSQSETRGSYNDHDTATYYVLMIMAIAATSLSQKGQSTLRETSRRLFRRAIHLLGAHSVKPETLEETIQGLLLLIQYGMLNPSDVNVSYLVNVGVHMCVDLRLRQGREKDDEMQKVHRRLYWAMYTFDRRLCIARSEPWTSSDEDWQLGVHKEDPFFYQQKCRIIQLQSSIFDHFHARNEVSPNSVQYFATALATWDQEHTQLTSHHHDRSLLGDYYRAVILLYRPCQALRRRSLEDLSCLWKYSLEFAQLQRECTGETLYPVISAEWAFMTGMALIYSYQEIVRCKNHRQHTINAHPIRINHLWAGLQNISNVLQAVSQRWASATNILHKFEHIVGESIAAIENLTTGCGPIEIPEEVGNLWRYASVTRNLPLDKDSRDRGQDQLEQLIWDIVHSTNQMACDLME